MIGVRGRGRRCFPCSPLPPLRSGSTTLRTRRLATTSSLRVGILAEPLPQNLDLPCDRLWNRRSSGRVLHKWTARERAQVYDMFGRDIRVATSRRLRIDVNRESVDCSESSNGI